MDLLMAVSAQIFCLYRDTNLKGRADKSDGLGQRI